MATGMPPVSVMGSNPDPQIRGLMGNPVFSNAIKTNLIDNPQVVGAKSTWRSNPWNVGAGHNPQDIGGALDDNYGRHNGVEDPIALQFLARHCDNGAHRALVTGQLVFMLRSPSQKTGRQTIFDIGSLNIALSNEYYASKTLLEQHMIEKPWLMALSEADFYDDRIYKKWKKQQPHQYLYEQEIKNPSVVITGKRKEHNYESSLSETINDVNNTFITSSDKNGSMTDEDKDNMKFLKKALQKQLTHKFENVSSELNDYERSRKHWKKHIDSKAYTYLMGGAILDHWNFIGVIKSSTNDGFGNRNPTRESTHGVPLSVVVAKKTHELYNIWSDGLQTGDLLYLILKRKRELNSDSYGPFLFEPWSNGHEYPSDEDRAYVDIGGSVRLGKVIYVGRLSENLQGATRPSTSRAIAAGFTRGISITDVYQTILTLDKIVCHVAVC